MGVLLASKHTVCVHAWCSWWPEERARFPGTGVTDAISCYIGTENRLQVLGKSSKCSQPLSLLFRACRKLNFQGDWLEQKSLRNLQFGQKSLLKVGAKEYIVSAWLVSCY